MISPRSGDTVNSGARLQAQARPGEIVMSDELYRALEHEYPGLEPCSFKLRGRVAVFEGRVLKM